MKETAALLARPHTTCLYPTIGSCSKINRYDTDGLGDGSLHYTTVVQLGCLHTSVAAALLALGSTPVSQLTT